ncbi:MAG: pseudouridine synthase [Chitinophagaceae bacterium]
MQKKSSHFDKFKPKKSNAAVKEQFKQEKRKFKKERADYFDKKRDEVRGQSAGSGGKTEVGGKSAGPGGKTEATPISHLRPQTAEQMPLNKYIAHAGLAGRREAAELVKKGLVKVNGELVTEPGHKVSSKDEVNVNGKKIFLAKNLVYILLNKPKDFITTTDDPQGRKTVLDIIGKATPERVYPVGRLDRNTSGVLLLTNDGELAQKLTHPSNEIKKVYHVTLNKPLEKVDFDKILKGIVLEDGPASVDALAFADVKDKTQIGVEIHSGRNRIVRRIFEALGYDVKNLDRVIFAGLTKKNIERGKFRFLSEKEVRDLKHFGKGK